MEPTRVFIKNLPGTLMLEDFRKHFSQLAPITDAQYFATRRYGYIGYENSDNAIRAVKYFNRSFYGTTRLKVALARSISSESRARKTIENEATTRSDGFTPSESDSLGRPKTKPPKATHNQAMQEYMEVAKLSSRPSVLDNEDILRVNDASEEMTLNETNQTFATGDEVASQPKKRLKINEADSDKQDLTSVQSDNARETNQTHPEIDHNTSIEPPNDGQTEPELRASNADWLRSRTSRLLGLEGEDDESVIDERLQKRDPPDEGQHLISTGGQNVLQPEQAAVHASSNGDNDGQLREALRPPTSPLNNEKLFVRNLSYTIDENDLRSLLDQHGVQGLEEIRLPINGEPGQNKGFAHLRFDSTESAMRAVGIIDRKTLHGRIVHALPDNSGHKQNAEDYKTSTLPWKKQREARRKGEVDAAISDWNAMFLSPDAAIASIAERLNVSKSELLDPTSGSAAVGQAHAETHIIQETKNYLIASGVNLSSFDDRKRGDQSIVVKNLRYGVQPNELRSLFETYGEVEKFLMPPSGTMAIISFRNEVQGRQAFRRLAYCKFKGSLLYLEKAPITLYHDDSAHVPSLKDDFPKANSKSAIETPSDEIDLESSTLYIRNLNFTTSSARLKEVFQSLEGFLSAKVQTKVDPKRQGQILSLGFGFVEFRTKVQAQAAMATMNGYALDGHDLLVQKSRGTTDEVEKKRRSDRNEQAKNRSAKIIIKNIPFEASKLDIRNLFGNYGQLRSVRLPKTFNNSSRGFAFAEFLTPREARNAMSALQHTHLLGRKLVLEFATADRIDPEVEIDEMQRKAGEQRNKIELQQLLSGSGRRKFTVEGGAKLAEVG